MRVAWVGVHEEGVPALEGLVAAGVPPVAVLTLTPERAAARSASADYGAVCRRLGLPLHYIGNINDEASVELLRGLDLDVLFVIGWGQILRPPALRTARLGVIGAHASLLPHNRGSAPVNWALIRGECRTGNSLMWLAEGVDEGDLIDQVEIPITPYDTCASLYRQVAVSNREMILRALPGLAAGRVSGRPQGRATEPVLPRRRPADGRIDWRRSSREVYDFVRALTRPYPGAFSDLQGRRWVVWHAARLPDGVGSGAAPGQLLGPVVSPRDDACGHLVACGTGAVALLEVEDDGGVVWRGRALSELPWTGLLWDHD